jgi:hypothetical protein
MGTLSLAWNGTRRLRDLTSGFRLLHRPRFVWFGCAALGLAAAAWSFAV